MKKNQIIATIGVAFYLAIAGVAIYSTQAQKPVENAVKGVQQEVSVPLNADKILELVNAERAKVGAAPLVSDPRLVATAQSRVDDMIARDYYSHNDPITGESLVKIKPTNPQCIVASENINAAITNEEAVAEWLSSKPHHDAMLDTRYSLTGISVAKNPKTDWYYLVQHFCQVK